MVQRNIEFSAAVRLIETTAYLDLAPGSEPLFA
jgi:hypothetical protein